MRARRVRLRVLNVPWMEDYHGREAGLVGEVVDAVELDHSTDHVHGLVAYVDDRDGEASEYIEALGQVRSSHSPVALTAQEGLRQHAERRLLHGDVVGVRT